MIFHLLISSVHSLSSKHTCKEFCDVPEILFSYLLLSKNIFITSKFKVIKFKNNLLLLDNLKPAK